MMLHIKRFMDKVAMVETKTSKDVVLPIADARGLRDEVAKLLADLYELSSTQQATSKQDEVIQVEIRGGTFK
jgi:hypothetical protein